MLPSPEPLTCHSLEGAPANRFSQTISFCSAGSQPWACGSLGGTYVPTSARASAPAHKNDSRWTHVTNNERAKRIDISREAATRLSGSTKEANGGPAEQVPFP